MNSSFLYNAWGLYHHKCLREEHKGNTIILHIESKGTPKYGPKCGHPHLPPRAAVQLLGASCLKAKVKVARRLLTIAALPAPARRGAYRH